MTKRNIKVVYQSIWSEKITKSEKLEAEQRLDDAFNFIFNNTILDSLQPADSIKVDKISKEQ